jgi:hypothetical protein
MKRRIYILLSMFLGLELSFIVHAIFEVWIIKIALANGKALANSHWLGKLYCVLPTWLSWGLALAGLTGGFFLGRAWWRIVYIEHRHWRFKQK